MIKTRVQTQELVFGGDAVPTGEQRPLLRNADAPVETMPRQRLVALQIARQAYQTEGIAVFFRGLGVCSVRAFIVNAVQWAVSRLPFMSSTVTVGRLTCTGVRVGNAGTSSLA